MKNKFGITDRIIKALESFTISYAFVIMIYVLISSMGVFDPIGNEMAVKLLGICLVIAIVHFFMGFLDIKSYTLFRFLYFVVEVAVVLFMGLVVYDGFFIINVTFFICLFVMLIVVFIGTYLIAFYGDWKKVQEINEIIRKNRK